MSRSSDVRDAVIASIEEHLPDQTIEPFIIPNWKREELAIGPRIGVRFGNRQLRVDQGPDERNVTIEVGVAGVTPKNDPPEQPSYRLAQISAVDAFDGLMESVIALWTPNGVLSRCAMADHRFVGITQSIQFDADQLYSFGIWLSMVSLEYMDCSDE